MSFYDDSTMRKNKQVILDCCPLECTLNEDITLLHSKSKRGNIETLSMAKVDFFLKNELPLGKERD